MKTTVTFTDKLTGLDINLKKEDIETYRGNSDYTSIYLKNDKGVYYVKEDFFEVDKILDL